MKRIIAAAAVLPWMLAVAIPANASTDHWLANKTAARAWGDPRFDLVMGSPNAVAAGEANVRKYYSYRDYLLYPTTAPIVLFDIERKSHGVPLREQRHPKKYMRAFVTRAHDRGQLAILAPGKSLVIVAGGDCTKRRSEDTWQAYLRCRLPSVPSDYLLVQSQNLECNATTFEHFVRETIKLANSKVLVELTVLYQDYTCVTASRIHRAWSRVQGSTRSGGSPSGLPRRTGYDRGPTSRALAPRHSPSWSDLTAATTIGSRDRTLDSLRLQLVRIGRARKPGTGCAPGRSRAADTDN
jgi:hypothetical protein